MNNNLIVISGADSIRYRADENHKKYCERHQIPYNFYLRTDLSNPFFTKCYSIIDCFDQGYEHVVWIDDDAFFIDLDWDLRTIFDQFSQDVVVTRGRLKKSGVTYFNNGIMFIRNTEAMRSLFERIPTVSLKEMQEFWKADWGPMVGNDQPRMIYLTQTYYQDKVKIIDYPGFNAAEVSFIEYVRKKEKFPPIVHITGRNKIGKLERFIKTTNIKLP